MKTKTIEKLEDRLAMLEYLYFDGTNYDMSLHKAHYMFDDQGNDIYDHFIDKMAELTKILLKAQMEELYEVCQMAMECMMYQRDCFKMAFDNDRSVVFHANSIYDHYMQVIEVATDHNYDFNRAVKELYG